MIRRLLRFAVAAFCLLSLLAALGGSWLWWECRQFVRTVTREPVNWTKGAMPGSEMVVSSGVMQVRTVGNICERGRTLLRSRLQMISSFSGAAWGS
jgi:hypothetical protein